MNANPPERLGAISRAATAAIEQAAAIQKAVTVVTEIEGEVQGIDAAAESLVREIELLSNAATAEIDGVIAELQVIRDRLRDEAERVNGEINNYAAKSRAAISSVRVIAESLGQLKQPAKR